MNPPSEDMKDLIVAASLGLTFATNLFVGGMPEEPDSCACVYDTGGPAGEADYTYQRPTFQVKVRGAKGDYRTAQMLAQSIRDALHAQHNVTVNAARYVGIWMETDVLSLGPDERQRPMFTVNFRIHRTDA